MTARIHSARTLLLLLLAALTFGASAHGQTTYSWTSGSGAFSGSANWSNSIAPPTDGTAVLDFSPTGTLSYSATNDFSAAPLPLTGFTFGGSSMGGVTIFTGSNNFQLGPSNAGIVQNGSAPVSFISTTGGTAAGSAIFNVTNNFTIGGTGTGTVTIGGATNSAVVTGSGNMTVSFTTPGTSANPNLLLGNIGTNSVYTGNLTVLGGYVKANRTGGNLFDNYNILTIAAGATFDMNSNAESFGGLQGSGILLGDANMGFYATGDRTWSGSIQGASLVTQGALGIWYLGGTNTYTKGTAISAGTIQLTSATALPSTGVVSFTSASTVLSANSFSPTVTGLSSTTPVCSLVLGGGTLTINSTTNNTFSGVISGSGAVIKNGTGLQGFSASSFAGGVSLALTAGSVQLFGSGGNITPAFSSSANTSLGWFGPGTLTIASTNGFNGSSLAIVGGTVSLDRSTNNAVMLPAQPPVSLVSSTLALTGNSSAVSSETVSGAALAGAAKFSVTSGSNQSATLNLGALALLGGPALNVTLNNVGSGTASVVTTTSNGITGLSGGVSILGAYATVNGTDWATVNGNGSIMAVSSTAYTTAAGSNVWGSTLLNSVTGVYNPTAGASTAALRFVGPASGTMTLSGLGTIVSGGILVTPSVGSSNLTISGGTLATSNGAPIYIDQYNPSGTLTISSTIAEAARSVTGVAGTFAKSVTQLTVPTTANLYPGMTITGTGMPTSERILAITGTNSVMLSLATTAANSGNLSFGGGTMFIKSGSGLLVLSNASTNANFSGGININEGMVNYSDANNLGAVAGAVVFNGGLLNYTGGSTTDSHPWLFGPSGGTINVTKSTLTKTGANFTGVGNFTKTGSAILSIGSNSSNFSGQAFINQGIIRFSSSQFESCAGMTIANGGQYQITDNGSATFQFASGATLTLNGSDSNSPNAGATGAFAVTVQSGPAPCPTSTFPDAIYLASTSLFTTDCTNGTSGVTTLKLTGPISGPGSLIVGGNQLPGIVQIGAVGNSYGGSSGTTTILGGILQLAVPNGLPVGTNLVLANSNTAAEFDLNGNSQTVASLSTTNFTTNAVINTSATAGLLAVNYAGGSPMLFSGNLGGSGTNNNFAFATTGSGVVVLDGNNYYTQGTTIAAGSTLQLGNLDGQGNINGNIGNSGSLAFNFGNGSTQVTTSATISGTGALINQSTGAVTLAGTNTYSGATLIQKGTIVIPSTGTSHLPATANVTLGSAAGNSGILQLGDNNGPAAQTLSTLNSIGSGSSNAVVGGYASSNSTLTVNSTTDSTYGGGLGTATNSFFTQYNTLSLFKSGTATLTLSGSNNCAGPTTVNAGVLQAGSSSAFSSVSALTVNASGTLRLGGNTASVGSLTGVGTVENANATPGQLTVVGAGNSVTSFSGVLQNGAGGGSLALYKTGAGGLTLVGNNTYTGATTVNGGTMGLLGATTQASPFTLSNGAALALTTSTNTVALGSNLTLGTSPSDTAALDFALQGSWSASTPILAVSGALTTAGTTTINLSYPIPPPVGNYPLIAFSGNILGSGSNAIVLGRLPSARVQASLLDVKSMLELNVTSSDSPKWTGTSGNAWDTSSANWALINSGGTTTFLQGDNVLFDDTAAGPTAIALNQTVTPATDLFSNNGLAYSVSGSGKISGGGSLTVAGSAGVVLLTDNDYTGGTTVSAGTLQLGNGGTTGSVAGAITNNAMLAFNRSDSPTFAGAISGSGQVAIMGGGQITLTGSNTYAGPTNLTAGTLQVGGGGNSGSITSDVVNSGALLFSRSDTWTYTGAISGSGSVTQAGPGAVVFAGNHSYFGSTTVTGGTLQLGGGGTSGSIATDVSLANNSSLAFNRSDSVTYGGAVSGNGSLAQQGPGNLLLTGTNTYTQGTQINGGTLTVANVYNLSQSSGNLSFNGGTLRLAGPLSLSQAVFLNTAGGTIDTNGNNVTLSGQISGGNLAKNGAGTLTVTNGNNYFSSPGGNWTVNNGAISIDSYLEVSATTMALNGGTLQVTANMGSSNNPLVTTGTEFPSNIVVQVGANGATLDTGSNWFTSLGTFSSGTATTLNKIGSGTWYNRGGLPLFLGNVNILAGTLLDDPTTGVTPKGSTDAASNSTVINVAAGATWDDSWGNGETMGSIAGAGTILVPVGAGLSLQANVVTTFSGVLRSGSQSVAIPSGNSTFSLGSGGSITLTNSASDFGGQSTINNGTVVVSAAVLNNVNGPLGNANSEILLGNNSSNNNAALLADTPGVEIGRDVRLQTGNTGISSIGGLNTSGTVTFSGGLYLGTNSAAARPLTVVAASGGTVLISGPITRPAGATGATDVFTINGPGSVVLSNSGNSYSGGTVLNAGTLIVSNPAGSVTGTGKLTLNGGTLASGSAGIVGGNIQSGSGQYMIAPGGIGSIGSLSIGGSASLNGNATLAFDINGSSSDLLSIAGVVAESGTVTVDLSTVGTLASSYTLATFANSPGLTFAASGAPANYHLSATNNDLILSLMSTGPAAWSTAASGSWTNPSNWSTNSVPSGPGQQAVVAAATTTPLSITLDGPQTLGTLTFGNGSSSTAGYTLAAGNSGGLTLDNSGSAAAIIVTGGSHGIAASVGITLNSNLVVTPTAGTILEIDGNIAENPLGSGKTLLLNDAGTLILSGSNNFSGGATVAAGTLILNNSEALADGSSLTVGDASLFVPAPVVPSVATGAGAAVSPASIAAVPEPSTLALFGLAATVAVLLRKRRGTHS